MKDLRLVNIKNEYLIISDEDPSPKDWMCDKNGYYEAPEIDGFIGFRKVIAAPKKLKSKSDLGFVPMIDLVNLLSFSGKLPKEGCAYRVEIETIKRKSFFGFLDKKHAKQELVKLNDKGFVKILKVEKI